MERTEAVSYLKEILSLCAGMSPNSVSFEQSKRADNSASYRVHIKGTMHNSDKETVKTIAQKHSLAVQEEKDEVIIYKT